MENKFILITALMAIFIVTATSALAAECSRSGSTMLITYAPSDLNVYEEFDLTYYDLFGGANQQATLNYPSGLTNSGADTITLINDGFGGGYWTWTMNSTMPGNYSVYINISYEEGGCNITKTIEILPSLDRPNLELTYTMPAEVIANQNTFFSLIINNTGVGTAYNINGWTDLGKVIDTFSYSEIAASGSETRDFTVNTNVCGLSTLESTANYQDNFGYNYQPSHINTQISVVGSDLEITDFEVSDTEIKKGKTLKFDVTIENNDRSTTIDAIDVVVKIYDEDDDLIETINFVDIEVGESATGEGSWKVSGKTGKTKLTAVISSDNECGNWDNEETVRITINKEEEDEDDTWPWPDDEEEEDDEDDSAADTGMPTTEPEEDDFGAIAITAIALEIIALALVIVYIAKRKTRRKRKPVKTKIKPKVKAK